MAEARPFSTFNFKVNLKLEGDSDFVCDAAFSACDGLEMSLEPRTIREGGNNGRQIHLAGPVSYGQLSLKRGMTSDFGLWTWFERVQANRELRASGEIAVLATDRSATRARFALTGCLVTRIKAPALAALDGQIAIEEVQIAYETLTLKPGDQAGG